MDTPERTDSPQPDASGSFNISNEEAIKRLRAKGQPIRLFGETDKERRLRLRALELIEERGQDKTMGQNDFRKALEDVEAEERKKLEGVNQAEIKGRGKEKDLNTSVDLNLLKTDPDKLYPVIYYALKKILAEWGEWLEQRPGMSSLSRRNAMSTIYREC